ncbi:MAG TPA: Hsp20/alpha crystallin family protein [Acidimicrobiales bacterium]|nr:Hsp20/alpha crystallin family protein [Acidimicrobiales bacterium]
MLMRFDPFREFDRIAGNGFGTGRAPAMPLDAYRHGDSFVVHFDLPGADPDSIDLTVEKNVLTVKAERSWQPAEGDEVVVAERPQGSFVRQLFLGETLDSDRIEARYDRGVLTVTIAVAERARPRRVAITTADGAHSIDTTSSAAESSAA